MKATGLLSKLYVSHGEHLLAVSGQRGATLNRTMADIDTTSKDDVSGWETSIAGLRNWDISADGAWVLGDTALAAIEDAFMSEDHNPETGVFDVYLSMPSGQGYRGQALVTSLPVAMPHGDLITYTLNFKGTGPLRKEDPPTNLRTFSDAPSIINQMAANRNSGGE